MVVLELFKDPEIRGTLDWLSFLELFKEAEITMGALEDEVNEAMDVTVKAIGNLIAIFNTDHQ
jgi:hypothetical protein